MLPTHMIGELVAARGSRRLRAAVTTLRAPALGFASGRLVVWTLVVATLYFGGARLGLAYAFGHTSVGALWAPTGIALAAVVLGGYRMLPGVALGAFCAGLTTPVPFLAVLGITVGSTLEALVAGALLRRARFEPALERMRDVVMLITLAGVLSTFLSATIGVLSLSAAGGLPSGEVLPTWRAWWLADMAGDLLIGAAILVLSRGLPKPAHARHLLGLFATAAALAALAAAVFSHTSPLAYGVFPALFIVALTYRQHGAVIGGLIVSALAVWFTSRGRGVFVTASVDESLLRAQTYACVASMTALFAAAARSERELSEATLSQLADSERAFAEAQRLANIGNFEWDIASDRATWSDELYRILGLSPVDHPASYELWRERVHPDDREMVDAAIQQAHENCESYSFVHRIVRPDGRMRVIECHGSIEVDQVGWPIKMRGTAQDITAFKLAEERFRGLLETAPDGMVIVDEQGEIVLINSQTERLFGYARDELIGTSVERLVPSHYAPFHTAHRAKFAQDPRPRPMGSSYDLLARRKDGSEFPVEISLSPLRTEEGMLVSAAIRDVTERKVAADALAHQASHDPLTGLPNRNLFLDRLHHALKRARRSGQTTAVLFLDLDDFKLVNDSLGHDVGDVLLVSLTPRLTASVRPGDTVARFGGDEFVVLCEDLASEEDAILIAERIAGACGRPVELRGHEHVVTASVGVVAMHSGDALPEEVLRDADAAMYRAKALGKGRVELFDQGMRARLIERIRVESELRHALKVGELCLFYQPVVGLECGEIVAVEALLRWRHPERGLLEPSDFIHVAESSGLIVPIGEWVIDEACRQAAAWSEARPDAPPIKISVNLSPRQVARSDVASAVRRALRETKLDPALLELEITESTLLEEGDAATSALRGLKSIGVRLVLDDFGTGYSSLSYLKRFTIDALKIDRSFVDGLGHDPEDGAIVNAVLSMAQALDVHVTAEGVETSGQLERLRDRGCGFAQGYLFSRPVPARGLTELLAEPPCDLEGRRPVPALGAALPD